MHERSVSPVEYHDLQTKTLLDLLKNISEEADDYASSSSEKGADKSPMVHLSRQLKKFTNDQRQITTSEITRGPMGNITAKSDPSKVAYSATTATSNIQVNVIQPSPVHKDTQLINPAKSEDHQDCVNKSGTSNAAQIPLKQFGQKKSDNVNDGEGRFSGEVHGGKCKANLRISFK